MISELNEPILMRIGINAGDILVENDDVFGDCVNLAARLQAAANPGGVLLSRVVSELAGVDLPIGLQSEGIHSFKNINRTIETFSVDLIDEGIAEQRRKLKKSQEIRFCSARDGIRLAWTENGKGAPVVKAPNWVTHLEHDWRSPMLRHIITSLAANQRLVRFDAQSQWPIRLGSSNNFV